MKVYIVYSCQTAEYDSRRESAYASKERALAEVSRLEAGNKQYEPRGLRHLRREYWVEDVEVVTD